MQAVFCVRTCTCISSVGTDIAPVQGIVSGLGRELTSSGYRGVPIKNVIQTDAAINPGNSGGVLLDSKGRLIGINTAIADPSGRCSGTFKLSAGTATKWRMHCPMGGSQLHGHTINRSECDEH